MSGVPKRATVSSSARRAVVGGADVSGDKESSGLCGERFTSFAVAVEDGDLRSLGLEQFGDGPADSGGAAR